MWFDPGRNIARRFFIAALLFFAGGTYLYVWCELLTPRWYYGRFRSRFGALVSPGELAVFSEMPD